MVKYTLLHKPTLSTWPSIPRQLKTIIIGIILTTLIFLIFAQKGKYEKLRQVYEMQATIFEILDLEVKYMPSVGSHTNDRWEPTSVKDGMIYSAYLDSRPEIVLDDRHHDKTGENTWAVIRVIAILPLEIDGNSLTCYYKYKPNEAGQIIIQNRTASRVKAISENWGLKYSAFFVLCDLTLPLEMSYEQLFYDRHLPVQISIGSTTRDDLNRTKFIDIWYPRDGFRNLDSSENASLSLCGPVFHHEYDRALHLVEFIEYYLMQGVDHFTFYNKSVSSEVSKVLQYYADKGTATILQWNLPPIYQSELTLRMDGSFAAWNDCLYRSSFYKNYKYVLLADVDEFIVPRKHENLTELMGFLDPPNNSNIRNKHASFEFRNVFFYLMHPDDQTDYDSTVPYLYLQAKTERVKDPEEAGYLTKYIARSKDVVELGYHKVWFHHPGTSIFMNSFDRLVVDADVALSHHYSDCEAETAACHFRPTIIDRTTHKYIKEIGRRLKLVCTDIFKDAGCPAPKN